MLSASLNRLFFVIQPKHVFFLYSIWVYCIKKRYLCHSPSSASINASSKGTSTRYISKRYIPSTRKCDESKLYYRKRNRKKPQWVVKEILYLKAVYPDLGHRKVAQIFNRRFSITKNMTVSKSYVANLISRHKYEIQVLRHHIKHQRPKSIPKNLCWGLDLTTISLSSGKRIQVVAMVDYGSRMCIALQALPNKRSITLLNTIRSSIKLYGKPNSIKTDNEACFTSPLLQTGLTLLSISHQRSEVACPWQNGRVERFIGTFKQSIRQISLSSEKQLTRALEEFKLYYNHIRPHQHLDGCTPYEIWHGSNTYSEELKGI